MTVLSDQLDTATSDRVPLNDFFSIVAPSGWHMTVRLVRSQHGSKLPPILTFRPPTGDDVALTSHVVDWLEDQPELEAFRELLSSPGECSTDLLGQLFPALLRVPSWYVTSAEVVYHGGLGWILLVDYDRTDIATKGRIIYAPSPCESSDVQVISYEGKEPAFSVSNIDALLAMESLVATTEEDTLVDFLEAV